MVREDVRCCNIKEEKILKRYLYCVPTNRILEKNFEIFCDEVMHALHIYHCNISFVVTDDRKEKDNFVYVKKLAEK